MLGLVRGGSVLLRPASAYAASDCHCYTVKAGDTLSYIGQAYQMISQIFGSNAPQALSIAQCASGPNPNAYNPISIGGSHTEGVFQLLYPSTWSGTPQAASSPYDAWANIQAAHAIFVRDGYSWREWTCQ